MTARKTTTTAKKRTAPSQQPAARRKHPTPEPGKTRAYDSTHRHVLNAERQKMLLDAITIGTPLKTAALYAGIENETLRKWRARGEDAQNVPPGKRSPTERKYADFVGALGRALATAAHQAQLTVTRNMTMPLTRPEVVRRADGTDEVIQVPVSVEERRLAQQAAQFHLTHRSGKPETDSSYSTQTRTEVTGADGAPLELSAEKAWERISNLLSTRLEPDDEA